MWVRCYCLNRRKWALARTEGEFLRSQLTKKGREAGGNRTHSCSSVSAALRLSQRLLTLTWSCCRWLRNKDVIKKMNHDDHMTCLVSCNADESTTGSDRNTHAFLQSNTKTNLLMKYWRIDIPVSFTFQGRAGKPWLSCMTWFRLLGCSSVDGLGSIGFGFPCLFVIFLHTFIVITKMSRETFQRLIKPLWKWFSKNGLKQTCVWGVISSSPSVLSFGALVTWITPLLSLTLSFSLCSSFFPPHHLQFLFFSQNMWWIYQKKMLTFAFICHFVLILLHLSRRQSVEFSRL